MLTLIFVTAVPILGIFTSYVVGNNYNEQFVETIAKVYETDVSKVKEAGISLSTYCQKPDASQEVCSFDREIKLLKDASSFTTFLGLGLIGFIFIAKLYAGKSRDRLASVFNPTTVIAVGILSISMLIQGGIFTYAVYLLEATFIKRVHFIAIGSVGLASLVGALGLFKTAFAMNKDNPMVIFGQKLDSNNADKLLELINSIAIKLGAQKPTNVIVGLEPNFYVTGAKVKIAGEDNELSGTSLYISLPYLSILNKDELTAVIGHELGHFKGKDTIFSMKFYPAYARLSKSIEGMKDVGLMSLPALATIGLIHSQFTTAEKTIGRERELEADKNGASINGSLPLVTALLKFSYYARQWDGLRQYNIDKLNEGTIYSNLPALYAEIAKMQYQEMNFDNEYQDLLGSHTSHPTDSHPTIKQRMASLGVSDASINKELLNPSDTPLTEYLNNPDEVTESTSMIEHRLMIGMGFAKVPDKEETE